VLLSTTKSNATLTSLIPDGTVMRIVVMSAGSRSQASVLPPAVATNQDTSVLGPVGPCSPGIQRG
jgi:hypothetical protein